MIKNSVQFKKIHTLFSSVLIKRSNFNFSITETDLENYVIEAVMKVFSKLRLQVASREDISEFDLVLKNAEVTGFKVDGSKVINPEGFHGKTIEVSLFVTVAEKGIGIFKYDGIVEEGSVNALMLREKASLAGAVYIEIGETSSSFFVSTGDSTSFIKEVSWGRANVLRSIGKLFDSTEKISEKIYERFISGEVSEIILSKLERAFNASFRDLTDYLSVSLGDLNFSNKLAIDSVFINSFLLPETAFEKKFLFNNKRVRIVSAAGNYEKLAGFIRSKSENYSRFTPLIKTRIKWLRV